MAAAKRPQIRSLASSASEGNVRLTVSGFKAIREPTTISIAPLTIIAGVNSSGKSSFMQLLLMMKQTLEAPFDPGALLLYGPNVKFTEIQQIFSKGRSRTDAVDDMSISLRVGDRSRSIVFSNDSNGIAIKSDKIEELSRNIEMFTEITARQRAVLREQFSEEGQSYARIFNNGKKSTEWSVEVVRDRCVLSTNAVIARKSGPPNLPNRVDQVSIALTHNEDWFTMIRGIIHVPGLRGNPEREYPRSATGTTFPGTFETYVASIIHEWADTQDERLGHLSRNLELLGLTWKILAKKVNDASVALFVGRTPHSQRGGARDLVSVADVGFGVSQTLPVLVALLIAKPGQIVYLEQPEIHLHPRAQLALAECIVAAAERKVKIVMETHSSLLLRGIQTSIAQGKIEPSSVSMNWFDRNPTDGSAAVTSAVVDDGGRFGEWPVDFDDVALQADWDYLAAVQESTE